MRNTLSAPVLYDWIYLFLKNENDGMYGSLAAFEVLHDDPFFPEFRKYHFVYMAYGDLLSEQEKEIYSDEHTSGDEYFCL